MSTFKTKVCIVTGAAAGIGRALSHQLAVQGAVVIATDINATGLEKTVAEIKSLNSSSSGHILDVADYQAVKSCIEDAAAKYGRIDYLFNNAGIAIGGEIQDTELEHWQKVLNVNLNGVIHGSLTAYKIMAKQGFGHIVNISSVEGLIPFPLTSSYVTTKFAVLGLSQSMWVEGRDLGIKVSAVCPGFIKTDIFDSSPVIGISLEKWIKANAKWVKFGITSEECARAILNGVKKDKAIIPVTLLAKIFWIVARFSPTMVIKLIRKDFSGWRESIRA